MVSICCINSPLWNRHRIPHSVINAQAMYYRRHRAVTNCPRVSKKQRRASKLTRLWSSSSNVATSGVPYDSARESLSGASSGSETVAAQDSAADNAAQAELDQEIPYDQPVCGADGAPLGTVQPRSCVRAFQATAGQQQQQKQGSSKRSAAANRAAAEDNWAQHQVAADWIASHDDRRDIVDQSLQAQQELILARHVECFAKLNCAERTTIFLLW